MYVCMYVYKDIYKDMRIHVRACGCMVMHAYMCRDALRLIGTVYTTQAICTYNVSKPYVYCVCVLRVCIHTHIYIYTHNIRHIYPFWSPAFSGISNALYACGYLFPVSQTHYMRVDIFFRYLKRTICVWISVHRKVYEKL
jgi:hypothetical protein